MKQILWIVASICLFLGNLFPQSSTVVIAEVLYDSPLAGPETTVHEGEFLSLYNYGEDDVDISGWTVLIGDMMSADQTTYTYTVPTNTILPGFSLAVVAPRRAGSSFDIGNFYEEEDSDSSGNITLYTQSLFFPDTRSVIRISDAKGNVQDELTYDGLSDSLPGETLLRATNGYAPLLLGGVSVSIQRKSIKASETGHTISRDDYHSGTANLVRLYSFIPEEYSFVSKRKGLRTFYPEDATLTGTVLEDQEQRASNIASSQVIASGKSVYLGEEKIVLGPGFEVKAGAEFRAEVERDSFHVVPMLTYNLWGKHTPDYGVHAKYINQSGAAVVSVQEVRGLLRFKKLKEKTGMDGYMYETINAIFVRYGIGLLWDASRAGKPSRINRRLIPTWYKEDQDPFRAYIIAEFPEFCFIATHFNGNDDCCERMTKKIFDDKIFKDCKKAGKPIYVAGDMNNTPDKPAIQRFMDAGFKILNDISSQEHETVGRHIDLIMEHNDFSETNPYYKLVERGIPLTEEQKKEGWKNTVSDHYPYFVKVKMK